MTWLLEDAWTVGFVCLAVSAILIVIAAQVSRSWMFIAGVLCLLASIGLLTFERYWVTEREEVEQVLLDAAASIVAGDVEGLLTHVSPQAVGLQSTARQYMSYLKLDDVKVSDLKVTLNQLTSPPSAIARFRVVLTHNEASRVPYPKTPHMMEVTFDRVGDRWLASKYGLER